MPKERWQHIVMFLSALGLLISFYSLLHNRGFASGSFCTISPTVNCDIVNKGPFSTIAEIPVALIGVIGYGFLFLSSALKEMRFLFWASLGGLLFSLYLTGLEAFVLRTWCLLCLASQALILLIYGIVVSRGRQ